MARTKSTRIPRHEVIARLNALAEVEAVLDGAPDGAPAVSPAGTDTAPKTPARGQEEQEDKPAPPAPKAPRGPTVLQRMPRLASDTAQLVAWKAALVWAKDRAPDHMVHQWGDDGRERERPLFEDYDLDEARGYSDGMLGEMLNFFVLARVQYQTFL
jgi:hypothetical protein